MKNVLHGRKAIVSMTRREGAKVDSSHGLAFLVTLVYDLLLIHKLGGSYTFMRRGSSRAFSMSGAGGNFLFT